MTPSERPWPVTILAIALAFSFCFSLYNTVNAVLPIDSDADEGRIAGAVVGTLALGGLLIGSILSMSRWPYIFFGLGALLFAWRLVGGGMEFSRSWVVWYSGALFASLLVLAVLYWRRMNWSLIRFRPRR